MGAFTFKRDGGGEDVKEAPFMYIPNLVRKASDLIEQHRGYIIHDNLVTLHTLSTRTSAGLMWHGVIPRRMYG